jgi:hypothetical protein
LPARAELTAGFNFTADLTERGVVDAAAEVITLRRPCHPVRRPIGLLSQKLCPAGLRETANNEFDDEM